MGQYYVPTLINEDGSIRTLCSHAYDNGLKLMEHSYIGNNFVNAALTLIWKTPTRVAWIGDYSDEFRGDAYEQKLAHGDFMHYYAAAWSDGREDLRVQPEPREIFTLRIKRRYLVNHTQKLYLHIGEYIAANKWQEKGMWNRGKYAPLSTYDMCVNPLPLLTACGNGRGGGDYHSNYPDYDKIGTWAFDLIECTDKRPAGYEPAQYRFTEQQEPARTCIV